MAKRQLSKPLLVEDGDARELDRLALDDRDFTEDQLQALLFKHPRLLPAHELEPVFEELIPLAREVPTPAGPIDLLYLTADGHLVLVETKLWRNPEARRTVVAQLIDYAKEMARWSYEDLLRAIRGARAVNGGPGEHDDPLVDLAQEASDDFDEASFHDQLCRHLQQGRVLLLIVGDGIREDVEQLSGFLSQTPQLGFTLGLIEIGLYPLRPGQSEPMLVQPRIVARTHEITRAVVEIRANVRPSDISVSLPPDAEQPTRRQPITEQEFLEQLERQVEPQAAEFARAVLEHTEGRDWWVEWKPGGPLLKYTEPTSGTDITLLQLDRRGRLRHVGRYYQRCRKMGLPESVWQDYMDEIAALVPGAKRREFRSQSGNIYYDVTTGPSPATDAVRLAALLPQTAAFFDVMDLGASRFAEAVEKLAE